MDVLKTDIKTLLHISHTDIRVDSRILKEMQSLLIIPQCKVVGVGFELDEGVPFSSKYLNYEIVTLKLFTRSLRFLPRIARHILNFIELSWKLLFIGLKVKPAVVHCHDTLVLPIGWLLSNILGCKLVYDAHELESQKNGQTSFFSRGTLILEQLCWKRIDLLISVSDSILKWYHRHLGFVSSILILNSPVQDVDESHVVSMYQSGDYFHLKYLLPDQAVVFVYLGILGKGRCIESYLAAFSHERLREAHLVFVGYGDLDVEIKRYAELHSNIHLHPPVPHAQVVGIVKNADYGLCFIENISLSDYFCLPNKLFEYAFAGLDVLASDFPEIQQIVNRYSLGICCSPDSDSILKAVEEALLRKPTNRFRDISQLAWSAQADRLRSAYNDLLKTA